MQGKWKILRLKRSSLGFCSHAIRSTQKQPKKVGLLATSVQSLLSCARSVFERLPTHNKIIILGIYFAWTLGSLDLHTRGQHNPSKRRKSITSQDLNLPNAWLLKNCLPRSSPLYRLQISGRFGGIVTVCSEDLRKTFSLESSLSEAIFFFRIA